MVDANVVLRLLLRDDAEMAEQAISVVSEQRITLRYEVIAEVVYVLQKIYNIPREDISAAMTQFISLMNVETEHVDVLTEAFNVFMKKKFDFVDCVLYAFYSIKGERVFSFDKKLNKLLIGG
ncbi:MAG: PIN domain-containing protein [Synergistaceae bacterium]|nr:PIN domain-containing protein [Synergistaceae bacterium]